MKAQNIHHWTVLFYDVIQSTNDQAMQMLKTKKSLGNFVISADEQTSGKGQRARKWESLKGNSHTSYVLNASIYDLSHDMNKAALLGMITAITIGETLIELGVAKDDIFYKWPNDVLIKKEKIAGILPELYLKDNGQIEAIIVGAGVNLLSYPKNIDRKTTSIFDHYNIIIDPDRYLRHYLANLNIFLNIWNKEGFLPILDKWSNNSHAIGEKLHLKIHEKEFSAYFYGFSNEGNLLVRTDTGSVTSVVAGEIFFE